ncbi:MAG: hypothetical protein QGI21_02075 [Candidatus Poseidoniaceae archaeon]|jgi:hypothetical protein|nr:hypothetical protein [Candidatus Poseidoniaceae archaeon]
MSQPILSPDGSMMWDGSKWIPVNTDSNSHIISDSVVMGDIKTEVTHEHNTTVHNTVVQDSEKMVRSHLSTMIDAMVEGRLVDAKNIYEKAKQIDYHLAINLHDGEFHPRIVNALFENARSYCNSMIINYRHMPRIEPLLTYKSKFAMHYNQGVQKLNHILQWDRRHIPTLLLYAIVILSNTSGLNFWKRLREAENIYNMILKVEYNHEADIGITMIKKQRKAKTITIAIGAGVIGFLFIIAIV